MQHIIALYGHANFGKTATLNIVRELIRANGGVSLSKNPPYEGDQPETFRYKDMIICVCPGGDTQFIVRNNFNYAIRKNADILITACRTKGGTIDEVVLQSELLDVPIKWFRKGYEYHLSELTQIVCNEEFGQIFFDELSYHGKE